MIPKANLTTELYEELKARTLFPDLPPSTSCLQESLFMSLTAPVGKKKKKKKNSAAPPKALVSEVFIS